MIVGEQQKAFTVHEGLICARSKFFRNALNGKWLESDEKTVRLLDEEPDDFEGYLTLLYLKECPVINADDGQYIELAKLYVVAEELMDTKSKNMIVTGMLSRSGDPGGPFFPDGEAIEILYSGTPESSQARRLFVDLFCLHADDKDAITKHKSKFPMDFLVDLSSELINQRGKTVDQLKVPILKDYLEAEEDAVATSQP